jgi:hypothetical protein
MSKTALYDYFAAAEMFVSAASNFVSDSKQATGNRQQATGNRLVKRNLAYIFGRPHIHSVVEKLGAMAPRNSSVRFPE